ncbi:hypothetical protein SDC9_201001 [bioreactor metagenome]|uniref:Uncharacterized protein n=1 Tax=bioreactor metagenome TaxID=1076179 RepID=A0A645IQ32_9ZZZZ
MFFGPQIVEIGQFDDDVQFFIVILAAGTELLGQERVEIDGTAELAEQSPQTLQTADFRYV